tara:strand:- start:4840 stop:6927 length:2088 start_codon:yes stop_codon:yes gene_type:complete
MYDKNISESLTYKAKEPDVNTLRYAYEQTVTELESYFDLCRDSYDERRNFWPGKTRDHRKHGTDAFPWEGASDMESHVIDERITRLVSLFMSALNRSNIRAFPVEVGDIARSKLVSSFMKWMVSSGYIPRFKKEMELGANYLLERGILITYVGWNREDRTYLQKLDILQIGQTSPDLVSAIQAGNEDELVRSLLISAFPGATEERAQKAIEDLREFNEAELPVIKREIDAPDVKTLAPDGDFFFPPYVTDPQRAPYCFYRTYYTAQELENKVLTDEWDEKFVSYVIDKYRGVNTESIDQEREGQRTTTLSDNAYEANELIELVHGYQRLVDEDGSEGIYETIFHKEFDGTKSVPGFAKFELMNGYEDYPVVVTKLSEDSKRLYDTMTIPDILRGIQSQVKIERDARVDRNSISTMPPILHPVGQAPTDWGPGRRIPYRRKDDFQFAPVPDYNSGSVEMETTLLLQADRLVGLDEGSQASVVRKQFLVDKYLTHCAEVLRQCFRCFQRFGPDSVYFRVTGSPDPVSFGKGSPEENYDIIINYDVLNTEKEAQEVKLQQLVNLTQLDSNGRINMTAMLDAMANAIDPVLADAILQPSEQSKDQIVKDVTDDLAKIFAGIEMPARPTGAQMAMQIVQQYLQQPDVAQRAQTDEAFGQRIQKYMAQYQFQMQQAQNAQIGRIGTRPAQMGEVSTQQLDK